MRIVCFTLLLASLTFATETKAQKAKPAGKQTNATSVSLQLPLAAYVGTVFIKPNPQDSAYQLVMSRQRVRTVTKVPLRANLSPDTVEYAELDRRGNKVYVKDGPRRSRMKYNEQNQLLERTRYSSYGRDYELQEVFDLPQKQAVTFRQPADGARTPVMESWQRQRGDTTITETKRYPAAGEELPFTQIMARKYKTRGDTTYLDFISYDAAHQALGYDAYYVTGKPGKQVDAGRLRFQHDLAALLDTSVQARQWRSWGKSDAAILVHWLPRLRGQRLPTSHRTYDHSGRLVLVENLNPAELRTKAVTRTTPTSSLTIEGSVASTTSFTYDQHGWVIQEVHNRPDSTRAGGFIPDTTTNKTYSPEGLLLSETFHRAGGQESSYEYRYTYY